MDQGEPNYHDRLHWFSEVKPHDSQLEAYQSTSERSDYTPPIVQNALKCFSPTHLPSSKNAIFASHNNLP